jgi:hypothetical protein
MSNTITKKIYLEIEVEVTGQFVKGHSGSFYRSNGDPGDPPEPDTFEIESVSWNGIDITHQLDQDGFDFSSLEEECIEEVKENDLDYYEED